MSESLSFNHLHVSILASPGMGHLIPSLVLADRLATHHRVTVTVLLVTTPAHSTTALHNLPLHKDRVRVIHLSPVDISHLVDPSTKVVTQLCLMLRHAIPSIRAAVADMDPRPDAFFVDHFGTDALPVAAEFDIPKYVYVPSTAWFTALTLYCPILDKELAGEYVGREEYLKVPGCKAVRPDDVVDPMLDRSDQQYSEYVTMGKQMALFDGILLNTWHDLEPTTLQAFRDNKILNKLVEHQSVFPIGPLTRTFKEDGPKSEPIAWLDRQPTESVMYVSFGSGGVLSAKQITELAWGLELSRQRFLWVVRPPTDGYIYAADSGGSDSGALDYLPDGFLTRTSKVGLMVLDWAPQVEILNHSAVGGFLSHCGWNSVLENVAGRVGVPMIAWPLYAEQRMNAAFLVEEVGVAARPQELPMKAVVGRVEIAKLVRELMEGKGGKAMREKVKALKKSAAEALEDGGASERSMQELLLEISYGKKLN